MPIYVRAAGPEVLPPQIYNYNALNALALARKAQSLPSTTAVPEQAGSTVLLTDDSEGNVNGSRSSASDVDGAGATNTELSARNSEGPGDEVDNSVGDGVSVGCSFLPVFLPLVNPVKQSRPQELDSASAASA